jgi:hypothetical protein
MKERKGHETLVHELKCDPVEFIAILHDNKKATIRYEDRGYEEADYIFLRQTQYSAAEMQDCKGGKKGKPLVYTGRQFLLKITHVQEHIGLMQNFVCISFKVLDRD